MSKLFCTVRGPSKSLEPQTSDFNLSSGPVWTCKGSIGPRPLSPRALDLLDLAGAIYRAESGIRKRIKDPATDWNISAPVRDKDFWHNVGGLRLARLLGFLNRAEWTFEFKKRTDEHGFKAPPISQ